MRIRKARETRVREDMKGIPIWVDEARLDTIFRMKTSAKVSSKSRGEARKRGNASLFCKVALIASEMETTYSKQVGVD